MIQVFPLRKTERSGVSAAQSDTELLPPPWPGCLLGLHTGSLVLSLKVTLITLPSIL